MSRVISAVAGTIEARWNIVYSTFVSTISRGVDGATAPTDEGFYPTSTYGSDFANEGIGGDDAWKVYEPYLRQTERSSREQRDNHRWPTTREMTGSMEQTLRDKGPVLPCQYPRPKIKASWWS